MTIPSRNLNYPTAIKFGAGRIRELGDNGPEREHHDGGPGQRGQRRPHAPQVRPEPV